MATTRDGAGPIRVSANGRYFIDRNGDPFFWLGDTQWELFRGMTVEDAKVVLEKRAHQGFSAIQVMLTGVGDGSRPDTDGQTPWLDNNPATPNEAYFAHVDPVVAHARQLGLILVVGVFHQLQTQVLTTDIARAYARRVSERYRDEPNIIWTAYPKALPEYVPVLRELAAGLREGDDGYHLITIHPDPSPTSSSFIHDEEWLDFNMIQPHASLHLTYGMVASDYARTPVKPTVMAEGAYEAAKFRNFQMTLLGVRQQAYWSHFAGGHHSYGHYANWVSPETWRTWIDSEGEAQMGVYRKIITSLSRRRRRIEPITPNVHQTVTKSRKDWWNGVPDQSLFAEGAGEGREQNAAIRCANGDWAMVYMSHPCEVSLHMEQIVAAERTTATWLDPTTGEPTKIGVLPTKGVRTFAVPDGWQDAILRFER